jgi:hypothetical protein
MVLISSMLDALARRPIASSYERMGYIGSAAIPDRDYFPFVLKNPRLLTQTFLHGKSS